MFNSLYRMLTMFWRMLKSAVLRPFRSVYARLKRATNLTRQATKLVPGMVKSVTTIKVKPQSRKDYVDAGPVYIAKSLVFVVIGALVAIWLLGQFVVWPWMESKWFTAKLYEQEEKVETYTGKVRLYRDEEKTDLAFEGRLEEGKKTGKGTEYYESGAVSFQGEFADGLYEGEGKQQAEDGTIIYEGGFSQGLYEGEGSLYENGSLVYDGQFAQGQREGRGKAYADGALVYEGEFSGGLWQGAGKTYYPNGQVRSECLTFVSGAEDGSVVCYHENGQKQYEGTMRLGSREEQGTEYDENGTRRYAGGFVADVYEGEGTEYDASGKKKYSGGFLQGLYEGQGTLYGADGGVVYEGGFSQGLYKGEGTLLMDNGLTVQGSFAAGAVQGAAQYFKDGKLLYEGTVQDGRAQGEGTLYAGENTVYTGNFADGFIDAPAMLDLSVSDVRDGVFAGAQLSESQEQRGFVIKNEGLQAAVFCNYGYDDAEIVVHRVYLYGEGLKARLDGAEFTVPEGYNSSEMGSEVPLQIPGVKATLQTAHRRTRYNYEDYTLRVWTDAQGQVDLVEWRSMRSLTAECGAEQDSEAALVDELLDALGFGSGEASDDEQ